MLRIGTAGVPLSTETRKTEDGIERVRELSLDVMELEFVRQVYIKEESYGKEIRQEAEKEDVFLTVHAPYFINLNAKEKEKRAASRARIIKAAEAAQWCGANNIVVHSAFYLGMDKGTVYTNVKKEYLKVREEMESKGLANIMLRPELMGKHSQFGNIEELLSLCSEVDGILPCIDFAHLEARYGEGINNYDGFYSVLEKMEKELGKRAVRSVHFHFSAVVYSDKGERYHVPFDSEEARLKWKDMVKAWKDFGVEGTAISESPNIEGDALKAKKFYEELG
ncbi:MAG: hypothetical protein D6769_02425 [Methanobacteriota archaeon]|nr:MAG: hypothetical protein D6769_02425 [Euryarchaeota archaeon]